MTRSPARLSRIARAIREDSRANAAVEFALAAPILIALGFGAFDYGSAYVEGVRLSGAARAGAQQALYDVRNWQDEDLIERSALEEYAGRPLTQSEMSTMSVSASSLAFCACQAGADLDCSSTCPDGSSPGRFVRVSLSRSVPLTLPYPWERSYSTPVAGEAVVRVR
jgi:Flp pilus assembly protein TadG